MNLESHAVVGYGIDIAKYNNSEYKQALKYLNRDFSKLAEIVINTPYVYDSTININGFSNVIYVPAIIPVVSSKNDAIKTYTKQEANDELIRYIRIMLMRIQGSDDYVFDNAFTTADVDALMLEISQFVNTHAGEVNYVKID